MKNIILKGIASKILILVIFLCVGFESNSQQIPLYNQYNFTQFIYNPALSGYKLDASQLVFIHRKQWSGVTGAPSTTLMSFNGAQREDNIGYSGYGYYDKAGYIYTASLYGGYSYNVTLFDDFRLGAGMSVGVSFVGLDPSIYNEYTQGDNLLSGSLGMESRFGFDAGILMSYFGFDLGFSVPNIVNGIINKSDNSDVLYEASRHYLASLKYTIPLNLPFLGRFNGDVLLKPLALVRFLKGTPLSYELQLMLDIKKLGWMNVGYKSGVSSYDPQFNTPSFYIGENDLFLGIGFNITESVSLGYTFGTGITEVLNNQGNNHELVLVYNLDDTKKMKKMFQEELDKKDKERMEYIDAMEKKIKKQRDSLEEKLRKDIIINQNDIQDIRESIEVMGEGDQGRGYVSPKNLDGITSIQESTNLEDDPSTMPSNVVAGSKGFYIVAGAFKFRENAEIRGRELGNKNIENSIFFDQERQLYYIFLRKYNDYDKAVKMRGTNLNGKYVRENFGGDSLWIKEVK